MKALLDYTKAKLAPKRDKVIEWFFALRIKLYLLCELIKGFFK